MTEANNQPALQIEAAKVIDGLLAAWTQPVAQMMRDSLDDGARLVRMQCVLHAGVVVVEQARAACRAMGVPSEAMARVEAGGKNQAAMRIAASKGGAIWVPR